MSSHHGLNHERFAAALTKAMNEAVDISGIDFCGMGAAIATGVIEELHDHLVEEIIDEVIAAVVPAAIIAVKAALTVTMNGITAGADSVVGVVT